MPAKPLIALALVLAFALGLLIVNVQFIDLDHIDVNGLDGTLNDQVGYISVARHLAAEGHLTSSVIYPSTLAQQATKNYLYLPGHYWLLGLSFRLNGFSAISAMLPNIFAYLLSTVLVFALGLKLYGTRAAWIAALLFALFPLNVVYALTAMGELTLVAAVLVAITAFVYLPSRVQPFAGPLLVVVPLLFRETAAAAILVMFFVLLLAQAKRAAVFLPLAGLSLVLLLASPIATGRPSLLKNNLLSDHPGTIYNDAFATEGHDWSTGNVAQLLEAKFARNLHVLVQPRFSRYHAGWGEELAVAIVLAGIPFGFIGGRRRQDGFALGTAAATLALLFLILATYSVWGYRGIRMLLLMQPLAGVVFAASVARARHLSVLTIVLAAAVVYCGAATYVIREPQPILELAAQDDGQFLKALRHDDHTVLVAPPWLDGQYVIEHHPVRWASVPANVRTLQLLERTYRVGTIVYPVVPDAVRRYVGILPAAEVESDGWRPVLTARHRGLVYVVFRK